MLPPTLAPPGHHKHLAPTCVHTNIFARIRTSPHLAPCIRAPEETVVYIYPVHKKRFLAIKLIGKESLVLVLAVGKKVNLFANRDTKQSLKTIFIYHLKLIFISSKISRHP